MPLVPPRPAASTISDHEGYRHSRALELVPKHTPFNQNQIRGCAWTATRKDFELLRIEQDWLNRRVAPTGWNGSE